MVSIQMIMSALWEGEWVDPITLTNFGAESYPYLKCGNMTLDPGDRLAYMQITYDMTQINPINQISLLSEKGVYRFAG